MEESPNQVGRPSKYDSKYCDKIIDLMSEGLSIEACAGELGVHKDTIYEWIKNYPEFSDAKKVGEGKSQLFWERIGIANLITRSASESDSSPGSGSQSRSSSKSLNAAAWIFNMKNRFRWRDNPDNLPEETNKEIKITLAYDRGAK